MCVCRTCRALRGAAARDLQSFYAALADDFAELVQYNEDNRLSADPAYANLTINTVRPHAPYDALFIRES